MELQDIIIKPEFRDWLPSFENRDILAAKIEAEGWTDEPITVWQHHKVLLDGHNRYAIWQERVAKGIDDDGPLIRELPFKSEEEAFHWIVNNQRGRRNLTPEQERYLLGRKYTAEKGVIGGRRAGAGRPVKSSGQNDHLISANDTSGDTRKRVAKESGVGEASVQRAEYFADAVDSLDARGVVPKADILSGKVKAPATRIIKAAKAESNEEAAVILNPPPKPKKEKEGAPTQEPKREESTVNDRPMLTPKEERKRLLAFAKVEKAWTLMKEIPNDDEELRREAFEDLIHRLKCIIKRTK